MYRTLCVVVAVMLICATGKASVATRKMELAAAPKAEPSKMIAVDGLHVIVPNDVMVLPVDLLPQP